MFCFPFYAQRARAFSCSLQMRSLSRGRNPKEWVLASIFQYTHIYLYLFISLSLSLYIYIYHISIYYYFIFVFFFYIYIYIYIYIYGCGVSCQNGRIRFVVNISPGVQGENPPISGDPGWRGRGWGRPRFPTICGLGKWLMVQVVVVNTGFVVDVHWYSSH